MRKILFIILCIVFITNQADSQELKARISVVSQQIQGTNKQVFQTLQSELYEFLNNTKWTKHVVGEDERIECTFLINLSEPISADELQGTIQVQSSRPVYGSSYNTVMFNHIDKDFRFKYVEYQPIEFTATQHTSNLTSILAFYVYLILGLDYDSFGMESGYEYFQSAEKIVTNAQNAPESGWKMYEHGKKNRYWLIENLINTKYSAVREFIYKYHRQGLDVMVEKATDGRTTIAESLELLKQVKREQPNLLVLRILVAAKSDELINMFSEESFPDEKNRVVQTLKEIDPSNTSKYTKILTNR